MTKKGRGYEPAEKDPITFHAVPKFDHTSGVLPKSSGGPPFLLENLRRLAV
ncbi:1-deoxy-D-xylulose-5-phosphate synthase [Klebsiella pneumoniae]|nr:1-deoxy-D-xylulose-5-phosphate synthase [Klebsiella pneumoniae]